MCNSNQIGNAVNKVYSASDCTCHVIPVVVPMMSSCGEADVDIDEQEDPCDACLQTLWDDTKDSNVHLLTTDMAYRYLPNKYSIKCSYMQAEADDLPF